MTTALLIAGGLLLFGLSTFLVSCGHILAESEQHAHALQVQGQRDGNIR